MTVHALTPEQDQTTAAQVDKEIASERRKSARVFDELWADYLEAQARLRRSGKSDKACDQATDAVDGIVWRIIDTPAQTFIQLRFKFGVMHTML